MTFAVGIFDLFTYTVPGSLYLVLFVYLAIRLGWVDATDLTSAPGLLLGIGAVLLSYLIGFVAYPLGSVVNRLVPRRRVRRPREEFLNRVPAARDRIYVRADPYLLLSGLQLHDAEVAVEVTRLRATGLMLRNSAPPLFIGLVAMIVQLIGGHQPGLMATGAVVFTLGFFALVIQGRRLSHWATLKTYEICFWLPDVDDKVREPGPA